MEVELQLQSRKQSTKKRPFNNDEVLFAKSELQKMQHYLAPLEGLDLINYFLDMAVSHLAELASGQR